MTQSDDMFAQQEMITDLISEALGLPGFHVNFDDVSIIDEEGDYIQLPRQVLSVYAGLYVLVGGTDGTQIMFMSPEVDELDDDEDMSGWLNDWYPDVDWDLLMHMLVDIGCSSQEMDLPDQMVQRIDQMVEDALIMLELENLSEDELGDALGSRFTFESY